MERRPIDLNRSLLSFYSRNGSVRPAAEFNHSYVPEPELFEEENILHDAGIFHLPDLREKECVVILGVPGAGKSAEFTRLATIFREAGEESVRILCKDLESTESVFRSPQWKIASASARPIRLMIDGLEEGFLQDARFTSKLIRALEGQRATQEFRILVTSRPAEWSPDFEERLCTAWKCEPQGAVFLLQPLSISAQKLLAAYNEISQSAAFLQAIPSSMSEFAKWPRTLIWMAEEFRNAGRISSSFTDLCRRRASRLSENPERMLSAGNHVPEAPKIQHAMEVLAATLVYCGKGGIATRQRVNNCVHLDDFFLSNGVLDVPGRPRLTREEFCAAVQVSGLLSAPISGVYEFLNQTDAEFLASAMLASAPLPQLEKLFGRRNEGGRWRTYPSLATTAANLTAQNQAFFSFLCENDPLILLRVDYAHFEPAQKRKAIESMLREVDRRGTSGAHERQAHFHTLCHPELTNQLRKSLSHPKRKTASKLLALKIACECRCKELAPEVWELIWNEREPVVRRALPSAVRWLLDESQKSELMRLARGEAPQDDECEIAGAALFALFAHPDPGQRPYLAEVVPLFHRPPDALIGSYLMFLRESSRHLTAGDLVAVLKHLSKWRCCFDSLSAMSGLARASVEMAVKLLDDPAIRDALVGFWLEHIYSLDPWLNVDNHHGFADMGLGDSETRRVFLRCLFEDLRIAQIDRFRLSDDLPVCEEDFSWLLALLPSLSAHAERTCACLAAGYAHRDLRAANLNSFERAYSASSALRELLPPAGPDGIHSEMCRLEDETDAKRAERRKRLREDRRGCERYDHSKAFQQALNEVRSGKINAWVELAVALSMPPADADVQFFLDHVEIEKFPGWIAADESLRKEIRETAKQFLLRGEIKIPERGQFTFPMAAAVRALSLFENLRDDLQFRKGMRKEWIDSVLGTIDLDRPEVQRILSALAALAPDAISRACGEHLTHEWNHNRSLLGWPLHAVWSPQLSRIVASLLRSAPLQPQSYLTGLRILDKCNASLARSIASGRLMEHREASGSAAKAAAIAACIFVFPELWSEAWQTLDANKDFAKTLLLDHVGALDFLSSEEPIPGAPPELLAPLLDLLHELFPASEDRDPFGSYSPNADDLARELREHCRAALERAGRHRELRAIYDKHQSLKSAFWVPYSLDKARDHDVMNQRRPMDASQFCRFLSTECAHFISDVSSLQQAVLAAVRQFGTEARNFHSGFWINGKPQEEEFWQKQIARFLRAELNRVVINTNPDAQPCGYCDIRIDALVENVTYSAIVEVKFCKSKDVGKKMETQLVDYVRNQRNTCGIYLVCWVSDEGTSRRSTFQRLGISKAAKYLERQARRISGEGFAIASVVVDCRKPAAPSKIGALRELSRRNPPGGIQWDCIEHGFGDAEHFGRLTELNEQATVF